MRLVYLLNMLSSLNKDIIKPLSMTFKINICNVFFHLYKKVLKRGL